MRRADPSAYAWMRCSGYPTIEDWALDSDYYEADGEWFADGYPEWPVDLDGALEGAYEAYMEAEA